MSKYKKLAAASLSGKRGRVVLGFIITFIILAGFWVYWILQPVSGKADRTLHISNGSSSKAIGALLYQNGLIRSQLGFRIYLIFTGNEGKLKAGDFQFKQGESLRYMVDKMVSGDRAEGTIRFTIPEGFTIEQIANLMQKDGIVSKQSFLNAADHDTFHESFIQNIPNNSGIRHRLEGYLFPDTYEIYKGTSAHDIIDMMLKRMQQVLSKQVLADMKKQGLTIHQALTIASMVEREAKVDKERSVIAGVIDNRLHHNPPMPLQIDATVEYVLGNKYPLSDKDLAVNSPYNTYLHQGLPPGPIASPGLKSILAAVHPDHNDYLYYVVKNDGSGEHYFSKTYAGQLQNEVISERNAARLQSATK